MCIAIFQAKQHRYRRARGGRFTKGADLPRDRPPFLGLTPLGWTRAPILFIGPSKGGRLTGCHLDPSPVLMTADLLVVRREADAGWIRYLFFGDDDFEFATRIRRYTLVGKRARQYQRCHRPPYLARDGCGCAPMPAPPTSREGVTGPPVVRRAGSRPPAAGSPSWPASWRWN